MKLPRLSRAKMVVAVLVLAGSVGAIVALVDFMRPDTYYGDPVDAVISELRDDPNTPRR